MPADTERMTVAEVLAALAELAYLERACAFISAGWVVKVADVPTKTTLARHAAADMAAASSLRRRIHALSSSSSSLPAVHDGYSRLMKELDGARDPGALILGMYSVIKPRLRETCSARIAVIDPIADPASVQALVSLLAELTDQIDAANDLDSARDDEWSRRLQDLWCARRSGPPLDLEDALWPPRDRAPRATRPASFRRGVTGAVRGIPMDPLRDPAGVGMFLHNFLNEEVATMELAGRNLYEHGDMPWEFQLDAARHAGDEARHALLVARAARAYGVEYGDYPVYLSSYEGQYRICGV